MVALKEIETVSLKDGFPTTAGGASLILTLIDPGRVTVCPGPICGMGVYRNPQSISSHELEAENLSGVLSAVRHLNPVS